MAFPFPAPFPKVLGDSAALTGALASAMTEARARVPSLRTSIAIVAIDEPGGAPPTFVFSGDGHTDTNYSASLLKVVAMYAAFQLRQSADNEARSSGAATSGELFAHLSATFDSTITGAVSLIPPNQRKAPEYRRIFAAIPLQAGGFGVDFTADFETRMFNMIVPGDNGAAAQVVMRLGYSWINGALASGGFFTPPDRGIWLAGTFTGALPPVRINSVNDGLVAQAMTCVDLANLYALMVQEALIDSNSSRRMLELLRQAQNGPEDAWITRSSIGFPGFSLDVTHTKIGLGSLKPENGGFEVRSEGSILRHRATARRFITVWQDTDNASLREVPVIIDRAVNKFLGGP